METIPVEQLSEDTRRLFEVLNEEPDLPCVVIGAAFLDSALAALLRTRILDPIIAKKLLAPEGPLGTYAARADLAYSLGLLKKSHHADLSLIGRIRNRFAHNHLGLSFMDPALQHICDQLHEWRIVLMGEMEKQVVEPTPEQLRTRARNHFTLTVSFVANWLLITALSEKVRKPKEAPCA
jgi:DNA-binding MltR family transcriptional regulator